MKKQFGMTLLLLIMGSLALIACDSLGLEPAGEQDGVEKTIFVGPEQVECEGVAPQLCLQVKENPEDEYTLWYDGIEGFTHEEGFEYELRILETQVENPPADASSIKWTLIEEVSKTPVDGATAGTGEETGATGAATSEAAIGTEEAAFGTTLEGTYWTLLAYAGEDGALVDALEDTTVSAEFADGQVNGSAGCNNYFGSYVADGESITIGPLGTTRMLCQPEEVMAQESGYLRGLESAQTYTIADGQLTLLGADGNPVVVFQATELPSLAGPLWVMMSYNNGAGGAVSALTGSMVTAEFDGKGNLSGSAGCNNYNAGYEADEATISIGAPLTTRKMCAEPEGIMDQESQYLAAIQNATVYTIRGNTLELRDDAGALQASYQVLEDDVVNAVLLTALGNITYQNQFTASGEAPLVDGEYSEPAAPDSATETRVSLTDNVAYGTFSDGRTGAAVVLVTDPGGSGTFYDLAAVVSQDGQLTSVATIPLGDRVVINDIAIVDGQIVIDMVQAGPDDAMAAPTQNVINTYSLSGNELSLISTETVESEEETGESDGDSAEPTLTNTDWRLIQFAGNDDTTLEFEPDGAYSVAFNDDNTFNFTADCNSGNGSYAAEGSSLTMQLGAITMALCPEGSYSDQFVQNLGNVVSYVFDDSGNLVLNLTADAGNLVFVNGAAGAPAESGEAEGETNEIVGVTWQWSELQSPVETIAVPNPENYTLLLNADGTFNYQADCNVGSGTYAIDDSSIAFDLGGPTTLAFCGENSLDTQFLTALGAAAIYFTQDGDLFIDMMADGGTMRFSAAGAPGGGESGGDSADIVDIVWKWEELTTPVEQITVDTPESYLLLLNPDGTVSIQADCNSGGGNYTIDGSSITIEILFTTAALCGEGSLDQLFINSLNNAAIYFTQDGDLFIDQAMDSGTLRFSAIDSGA